MDSEGLENITIEMMNEWLRSQGVELDDKHDKEIIPSLSIRSKAFHDGLLLVVDHNYKYGFIDKKRKR